MMTNIGEMLSKRRKELGLTLEEVGNAVGVAKSTVKKWETGFIANMKRDRIATLAKVLQISPAAIIGLNSEEGPSLSLPPGLNNAQIAFSGGAGEGLNEDDIDMLLDMAARLRKKNEN